ncbi:MAG: anaerobic ribonucleoside-triphosphate reductase activating protein [Chloroflexia bacterium]
MDLKGWVRTSLLDYPGRIACVLFTGGCNFRCPPCQNAELVLRPAELPSLPEEEVWAYLGRRAGLVDGVVLTGGEPTVQPDLLPFLRRLRRFPLAVKLDTNGYRPDVLAAALEEGLVDYVALDVKGPPEKYGLLSGRPDLDPSPVIRSIALLLQGGLPHEFRTTVVPGLLTEEDIVAVARFLSGQAGSAPVHYILQQFRPWDTLDPALRDVQPYPSERLREMANRVRPWVGRVEVRGV